MALRNQPYLPLYIQDYMTDEKLNMCSWQTQGIYVKILCILHKQEIYGKILFKQIDKQNLSRVFNFACILIRLIPCQIQDMILALEELLENGVLKMDDNSLYQKRMVKDGEISEARSMAGKKGGGNPVLFKQKDKQITEYENEYINIDKGGVGEKDKEEEYPFENFWNDYDKKVGDKDKLRKKWGSISTKNRKTIKEHIPKYKLSQPEKRFRKNPETYLNQKSWNDEIITRADTAVTTVTESKTFKTPKEWQE